MITVENHNTEIGIQKDVAVVICRVLVAAGGTQLAKNSPADRVTLPVNLATAYARKGWIVAESGPVKPSEIKAAGGVEKLLAANPKLDKLSKEDRKRLWRGGRIPGVPTEEEKEALLR